MVINSAAAVLVRQSDLPHPIEDLNSLMARGTKGSVCWFCTLEGAACRWTGLSGCWWQCAHLNRKSIHPSIILPALCSLVSQGSAGAPARMRWAQEIHPGQVGGPSQGTIRKWDDEIGKRYDRSERSCNSTAVSQRMRKQVCRPAQRTAM